MALRNLEYTVSMMAAITVYTEGYGLPEGRQARGTAPWLLHAPVMVRQ